MRRLYYSELSLALERDNAIVVMREEDPRCFGRWLYYCKSANTDAEARVAASVFTWLYREPLYWLY